VRKASSLHSVSLSTMILTADHAIPLSPRESNTQTRCTKIPWRRSCLGYLGLNRYKEHVIQHPTAVAVDICSNLYSPQSHACFFSSRARRSAAESSLLDRHQSSAQSDFGISTLFRRNRSRRFLVWVAWAYLCQQHSIVTYLTDKACTGGIDGNSSCQQNVRRLGRVSFCLSLEYRGLRRWC
jgi:hypothetical protein